MKKLISGITVSFESSKVIGELILSLEKVLDQEVEWILVDSGSRDKTREILKNFKKAKRFLFKKNIGFSKGNNYAFKFSKGEYLFFCNPDIILNRDSFKKCLDFLKVKKPLILVPKLEGKKGRYFFVRPLINISNFLNLKWKKGIISKKDLIQPAFSAIFIKKGVFEKLQGLDEKFFVYFTDVEFFRRFYNFYKKEDVYFIEQSFIHQEGSVLNSRKNTFLRYYDWARGFFLYFLKYGTPLEKILSLPFFLIFLKRAMLNYLR